MPAYHEMVLEAIKALKERNGSSIQAIKKHITASNPSLNFTPQQMRSALKKGVESGKFVKVKSSYKLSAEAKKPPPKAKKVAPKNPTKKPASVKKPTAKKAATTKTKVTTGKKPTTTKKAAATKKAATTKKSADTKKAVTTMKATTTKKTVTKKSATSTQTTASPKKAAPKKTVVAKSD